MIAFNDREFNELDDHSNSLAYKKQCLHYIDMKEFVHSY